MSPNCRQNRQPCGCGTAISCPTCTGATPKSITLTILGAIISTYPGGPGGGGGAPCTCGLAFNASWDLAQNTDPGFPCDWFLGGGPDCSPFDVYSFEADLFVYPYNTIAGGADTTNHVFLEITIGGYVIRWDYDLGPGTTIDCTTINNLPIMSPGNDGATGPAFGTGPGYGGWDDGCTDFSNATITATANF